MESPKTDEVVIALSKTKIILLCLGSFVFVGGSYWIWSIADAQPRFNLLFCKTIAVAGAIFFGLCGFCWCMKIFDGKPGLIIDEEGIVDNSSGVAAGRIPWDEINGFAVVGNGRQRFVVIDVTDPQRYVNRGGSLKRMLNAANLRLMGSPINISSNSLNVSFDELLQLLTTAIEKYKTVDHTWQ